MKQPRSTRVNAWRALHLMLAAIASPGDRQAGADPRETMGVVKFYIGHGREWIGLRQLFMVLFR